MVHERHGSAARRWCAGHVGVPALYHPPEAPTERLQKLPSSYYQDEELASQKATIVIHKGLTVTILGHRIDIIRDEALKVAVVRVSVLPGYVVTGLEQVEVQKAADLLTARAKRFLGAGWTVLGWKPPSAISTYTPDVAG